jgi:hypothetical protein
MKNTIKIATLLMITGLFTACQQPQSTEQVLADEPQRKEVMQAIVNNQEMMTEMADMMMNNEQGKMMMSGNKEMMSMMMGNQQMMQDMVKENPGIMQNMMQNMMQMCQNDSSQCNQMAEMMSGNHAMMQSMMGMMHQKGMMNEESYKNGMNMMGKGMMGKEGHGQ